MLDAPALRGQHDMGSLYEERRNAYALHMNSCTACKQETNTACWPENCHWYRLVVEYCPVAKELLRALNETIR